jgi:hypothetical protein
MRPIKGAHTVPYAVRCNQRSYIIQRSHRHRVRSVMIMRRGLVLYLPGALAGGVNISFAVIAY